MSNKVIAIDGPAASGKSTVAKRVAAGLGCLYVDSGALYRAVTWKALRSGVETNSPSALSTLLVGFPIRFSVAGGAVGFTLDNVDPGMELRTERVNSHVSEVAATPEVRSCVNEWLRSMTRFGDLVVEGRDIGTAVFPSAGFKFYLDAAPEERARRRYAEIATDKGGVSKTDIGESLKKRDRFDSNRQKDPLRIAPDAVVIDSTGMSIQNVADMILEQVRQGDSKKGSS